MAIIPAFGGRSDRGSLPPLTLMKPWYRSLLSWAAAFFAVAILWLWWAPYEVGISKSEPGRSIYLASRNGEIGLIDARFGKGATATGLGFTHEKSDGGSLDEIGGDACHRWSSGPFRGATLDRPIFPLKSFKGWFVAWWFVFCVHLLASVVALTWWRRRWRRKAEDLMHGGAA